MRGFTARFDKRYIALAPLATVVGLAVQGFDPTAPKPNSCWASLAG